MSGRAVQLARLAALARLKSEAEIARLAATAQSRGRLVAALAALGRGEEPLGAAEDPDGAEPRPGGNRDRAPEAAAASVAAPLDPALVRARLAHRAWIEGQRRQLNARLAMVEADWRRLQPVAAKAFGRTRVLDDLAAQARDGARVLKQARAAETP